MTPGRLLEEFHLSLHIDDELPDSEVLVNRQILQSDPFWDRLQDLVTTLIREFPTLGSCQWTWSR